MSETRETPQNVAVEQTEDPAAALRETISGLKDKESAERFSASENPFRSVAERLGERLSSSARQNLIDAQARAHGALAEELADRQLQRVVEGWDISTDPDEVAFDLFSPHVVQRTTSPTGEGIVVTKERKGVFVPEVVAAVSQSTDFQEVVGSMQALGVLEGVSIPNPHIMERRMSMHSGDASLPRYRENVGIDADSLHTNLDSLREQYELAIQKKTEAGAQLAGLDPEDSTFTDHKEAFDRAVSEMMTLFHDVQVEEQRLNDNLETGSIELPTAEDGFVAEFIIQRGTRNGEFATMPPQYILLIKAKPEAAARIALTDEPPVPPASEVSAGEEQKAT